jgi:hypothetical protein
MTTPRESQAGERQPGRSFEDPTKPLGAELLDRSGPSTTSAHEDFRAREVQAGTRPKGVAERATVIGVLRKMEELVAEGNLPTGQETVRRALELAAGRAGLTIGEYEALVRGDAELVDLERKVLEAASVKLRG